MALDDGPRIVTQDSTKTGVVLEVLHAGGWDNAAQMLFTYLVLCVESSGIMARLSAETTPSITASVSLTSRHPDSGPCRAPEKMHLNLAFALDAAVTQGVTINTFDSILSSNNYLWDTFLCVFDSETGEEVSLPPPPFYLQQPLPAFSAEQLQALSFPYTATSPARHQILTLRPGEQITRTAMFESSCLFHRYQKVLVKSRNYDTKLKAGQTAIRWIWGDVDDTIGPLGWGQLPVQPTEHVATFTFEEATEAETSFAQPYCHVDY
ncbi:hypothetical protein KCU62_g6245, partial [Aureobasidium sp. EXF-3399]